MNTLSLPYLLTDKKDSEVILAFMQNQNNVVKFLYNRIQENPEHTQKELTALANSMKNVFIDSWFKQSAVYKAKSFIEDKIIFGGKKLFLQRNKKKITEEQYQLQKLLPLYIIGESTKHGNRKFDLKIIENNSIIFKPEYGVNIEMQLPKLRKNYKKILFRLQQLIENNKTPITISIDLQNIYITYDEKILKTIPAYKVKNRIMSVDENPNYTGYVIKDWKDEEHFTIVKSGQFSIKELNDEEFKLKQDKVSSDDPRMKYIHDKRNHEIFEISKRLVNIAKSNNVECFAIEDLCMESKDKGKGKKYNRLVNNLWNRNKFESNLEKRLNLIDIPLHKMWPEYSSFIGNFIYDYTDCVNAAMEINRRCFCLINKIKPVVFPNYTKSIKHIKQSLEELLANKQVFIDKLYSWKELYQQVKNLKLRYRVSLEDCKKSFKVFRFFDRKSMIEEIQFI